jgi:exopolyphosphatase/guanosine-5'-triphosphate,3'-diphosphate pyrophosphatase
VPVGAAVDIGSYSVHLLVAEVHGHLLTPIADDSAFLGLGVAVDRAGELGPEVRAELVRTLSGFVERAHILGATTIAIVGTDPLRRATDAAEAITEIRAALGFPVAALDHEEEAFVALLGVNSGRPVRRETVLVDVGGGSTEILLVGPDSDPQAVGLPLGAARLTRSEVTSDPPSADDLERLLVKTRAVLRDAPVREVAELVAVGGTARSLLRVGPALQNRVLTVRRIQRTLEIVQEGPADEIAARFGIRRSRAAVLPAGATILLAAAERYGLDRIRVARGGIREGLILASVHAGPDWRARLEWLAHGWAR